MTFPNILTTDDQLERVIEKVLKRRDKLNENPDKLFTINKTAKNLGIHYTTLTRWIESGKIKTTADGRYITQAEINRFLNREK